MKKWNKLGIGVAAVALAIAAAGGAWAMWGGDDGGASPSEAGRQVNPEDGDDAAGATCLEGTTDCQDDPSQGGAAGSACLAGAEDCQDNPGVSGGMAMCAPGYPDCNDMVVDPAGECAPITPVEGQPTLTPEEYERALKACEDNAPAPCDDTPGSSERCLPADCAVSSDGEISCPETSEGDGSGQSEPGSAASEPNEGEGSNGAADPVAPAAGQ